MGRRRKKESTPPSSIVAFSDYRPEKIEDPLSTLGPDYECLTVPTSDYTPLTYLKTALRGTKRVWERNPDVILAGHFGPLTTIAVLLGFLFRIPVVVRVGGNPIPAKRERIRDRACDRQYLALLVQMIHLLNIWFVFVTADGYLAVSESLKEELVAEIGCVPDRIGVIPVSICPEDMRNGDPTRSRDELGIRESRIVLTVTNLQFEGKCEALREIVPDMLTVLDSAPNTAWVVAGDGRYRHVLEDHINTVTETDQIRNRIYLPGYVDEIADLYAAADVFVYVSYVDAYPNVILEAQANELPVVANAEHGIVTQIEDGQSGLLVDTTESQAFVTKLSELLENTDRQQVLGKGGYERVSQENTPDIVAEEMLDTIRAILAR
jgi:glycosyltransferase involved in cell wall biosynthesis